MLNFSEMKLRLLKTLMQRWQLWLILLLYYIIFLIIASVRSRKEGSSKINIALNIVFPQFWKDFKYTLSQSVFWARMAIIILSIIMLVQGFPIIRDIVCNEFVQSTVTYRHSEFDESDSSENGRIAVNNGNEDIILKLPVDWNEEEFPYGQFEGTVVYSKSSKIILAFSKHSDHRITTPEDS